MTQAPHPGRTTDGTDFASAAMMRLVSAGLAAQGILAPDTPPDGAHVARQTKRDLLAGVLAAHGPLAILRISDAVPRMPPEPVVIALRQARDLGDLLDRWARLETFSHARHKVHARQIAANSFELCHHAKLPLPMPPQTTSHGPSKNPSKNPSQNPSLGPSGTPAFSPPPAQAPSVAESLLVFGVLVALAENLKAGDVTLSDAEGALWRQAWQWRSPANSARLGPLTLAVHPQKGAGAHGGAAPPTLDCDACAPDALRELIAQDPLRRWTLGTLAHLAGRSARTLQRRLSEHGSSFSRLVAEARLQVAAHHLCASSGPGLAEIGFLSGYADQAHFARAFKKGVGTTPQQYRAAFQAPDTPPRPKTALGAPRQPGPLGARP